MELFSVYFFRLYTKKMLLVFVLLAIEVTTVVPFSPNAKGKFYYFYISIN